jgi:hypothetical protein
LTSPFATRFSSTKERVRRRRDDLVEAVLSDDRLADLDGLNAKLRTVFDGFTLERDGSIRDWTFKGGGMVMLDPATVTFPAAARQAPHRPNAV